jgi:hypothetical protein
MSIYTTNLQGENFTHRNLWQTSEHLKDMGDSIAEGSAHQYKAAAVFAVFAFEAYLNYLISKIDEDIAKIERRYFVPKGDYPGMKGKIKWILEKLELPQANYGSYPYQKLREIISTRDSYAHGKPESCEITETHNNPDHDISPPWYTDSASKEDTEQVMDCIIDITGHMHKEAESFLGSPIWWGEEALIGPLSYASGGTEICS